MEWEKDHNTEIWAHRLIININNDTQQFGGIPINKCLWENFLIERSFNANNDVICSPINIINAIQNDEFLRSLILVINWGVMSKTIGSIYQKNLEDINLDLKRCKDIISQNINNINNMENGWNVLTQDLGWTHVMASKYLHFLYRALGENNNPPVPIDGSVMIKKVYKEFKNNASQQVVDNIFDEDLPQKWDNRIFENYKMYMTAILTWANHYNYSTIGLETRIFNTYKRRGANQVTFQVRN